MDAWLLLRGLRTLAVRVDRINASALAVARALESNPAVESVAYPGERSEHERRARLDSGIPVAVEEIEAIEATCRRLGHRELSSEIEALQASAT